MKKIIITVIILLLVTCVAYTDTLFEQDGHDWRSWDESMKVMYLDGWFSAYGSLYERSYYMQGEITKRVENLLGLDFTIGEVMARLNYVYSDPENRNVIIMDAILIVTGKAYWIED